MGQHGPGCVSEVDDNCGGSADIDGGEEEMGEIETREAKVGNPSVADESDAASEFSVSMGMGREAQGRGGSENTHSVSSVEQSE